MGEVVRGKILRADQAHWDGKTATITRVDATGGTITGIPVDNSVDVLAVFGNSTSYSLGTITSALQFIGGLNVTLVFAPGTWTIDDDVTIASNFTCHIPAGCIFNVAAGKTLTFSGPVFRESDTWTSGDGAVAGGAKLLGSLGAQTPQVLTDAGAVSLTVPITHVVTTTASALTLADGTEEQLKYIVMKTDGGAATLTPDNFANGTTIVFDDVGDSADLIFSNGSWHWLGGTATLTGNVLTPQTLTDAGAVSLTILITHVVTTTPSAITLADGVENQRKFIVMKTDSGAATLTPDSLANGTSIVFDDVGDSADLVFANGSWHWIGGTATLTGNAPLLNIVEDTTPQLGADLECQGKNLQSVGVVNMTEQADADADVAGEGQWWVNTATPNEPYFTDDAGGDQLIDPSVSTINTQNGNYTLVLSDKGKTIHKASGGAGETITIPANSSVAFQLGTLIAIQNDGGGNLTVAITTDTLTWSDDNTTGSRTIADGGTLVIQKVTSSGWKAAGAQIT